MYVASTWIDSPNSITANNNSSNNSPIVYHSTWRIAAITFSFSCAIQNGISWFMIWRHTAYTCWTFTHVRTPTRDRSTTPSGDHTMISDLSSRRELGRTDCHTITAYARDIKHSKECYRFQIFIIKIWRFQSRYIIIYNNNKELTLKSLKDPNVSWQSRNMMVKANCLSLEW